MHRRNSATRTGGAVSRMIVFLIATMIAAGLWPGSGFAQLHQDAAPEGATSIDVIKYVRLQGTQWRDANDPAMPLSVRLGNVVDFRITVTNNGNVPLLAVTVNDAQLGFQQMIPTLGVGAVVDYSPDTGFSGLNDIAACTIPGPFTNTAVAQGFPKSRGALVMDSDVTHLNCVAALPASIQIEKQIRIPGGDWENADNPGDLDTPMVEFPSGAEYRIRIQNGSTPVVGAVVFDPMFGWDPPGDGVEIGNLAAGAVIYLLPEDEMNPADATLAPIFLEELSVDPACDAAETVTNVASVEGTDKSSGQMVTAQDAANLICIEPPQPDITIVKQIRIPGGDWEDADDPMDPDTPVVNFPSAAEYRIRVENTGETPLINVTVSDPLLGLVGADEVDIGVLGEGDVIYLLPQGEPNPPGALTPIFLEELSVDPACDAAETITNLASVVGEDKSTGEVVMDDDPANLVCESPQVPDIAIVKQIRVPGGDWEDADDPMDPDTPVVNFPSPAEYRIRIENTGDVPLIGVELFDPMFGWDPPDDGLEIVNLAVGAVIYVQPPGEPNPVDATLDPMAEEDLSVDPACDAAETVTNVATVVGTDKSSGEVVMDDDPANLVCEAVEDICLVIIDEEGLDNDFRSVENAADAIGVDPDELINDDQPTEVGNPPLLWNELVELGLVPDPQGRLVLMPTGQVDDEGWYALPPGPDILYKDNSRRPNCGLAGGYDEWIDRFAAGTLSQHCLDEVLDVMPLRNQDLEQLVGRTCNAVVYDSDISMNYRPIFGNLQGARYGLFTFTILALEVPGSIPESKSDTSLYDLWLYVEEPESGGAPFNVVIRDHEPDSIEINRARCSGNILTIRGESDWAPGAFMTTSVDGPDAGRDPLVDPFLVEEAMNYIGRGRYELVLDLGGLPEDCSDLIRRRLSIQTDEGGAYNGRVR